MKGSLHSILTIYDLVSCTHASTPQLPHCSTELFTHKCVIENKFKIEGGRPDVGAG